ncbi:hypothetical protein S40285_07546 [Stachybotrys chlorohalonatus IBT 40285]|uniref:Signal recognition particle subunit SRP72 n=1 Tax=Stachybotrys chlorohalonatus (strain IBT 40285) TaxID=1283841 RepID=A0A084QFN5_STAC4|nr:hypothetical protein S40285_07546 [Stachybotrys chlorohalonata IBT 40285]
MPQDPAAALASLLRSSTIDDHEEVLKAANAALKADKKDFATQHTRVVALLKLDRFDDALRAIAEGGDKLEASCKLEKAYALYKTGKLDDAAALLQSAPADQRSFSHVAAQVAYRAERFNEALSMYERLLQADDADEENDLTINRTAALAQAQWQGLVPPNTDVDESYDTFELSYNAACACIARGALDAASNLLQRAVRLCDDSDLSEEDKQTEMQPILAQQAYVYAKLGKEKEAIDIFKTLDINSDNEPDFSVIYQNNVTAIDPASGNPYLLQRKAQSWLSASKEAKLFGYQSALIDRNSYVIDLKVQKVHGVLRRTAKELTQAQHPTTNLEVNIKSVLNAAASAHGAVGKGILNNLTALLAKRPRDLGLVLTIIQIQLEHGETGAALAVLDSFIARLDDSDDEAAIQTRFSPGLVALAVSLMRAQGREASAKQELVKAATYWTQRPAESAASLLKEAGIELLRSSNSADLKLAGSAFEQLFNEKHGSHIASAGLVASLAPSDPSKVQQHLANLPSVESLMGEVDVERLVQAGVAASAPSATSNKRAAPSDAPERATKKRRRNKKLPKNYEEGKVPDPERWLPLRDRSSYRPKGKKGKKKAGESTQGGVVKEEETLELVGGGGVKVEKASAASSSKKKKKGKK